MQVVNLGSELIGKGLFIKLTKQEAYEVIASLSSQLSRNSSNSGRKEWRDSSGGYFSMSVDFD